MSETIIKTIIILLVTGWLLTWFRHFYLIRYPFQKYMSVNFPQQWEKMKNDTEWTPTWSNLYFSHSVYNFIWKVEENFGDSKVSILKKAIRRSGWQIMIYFVFVGVCGVIMVFIDSSLRH